MKIPNNFLYLYKKYMFFIGLAGHSIFVLQTLKTIKTHSACDVSLLGFLISFISVTSWMVYGVLIQDTTLFRVNFFGMIAGFICILTIMSAR